MVCACVGRHMYLCAHEGGSQRRTSGVLTLREFGAGLAASKFSGSPCPCLPQYRDFKPVQQSLALTLLLGSELSSLWFVSSKHSGTIPPALGLKFYKRQLEICPKCGSFLVAFVGSMQPF